jgi:hypothetical protein
VIESIVGAYAGAYADASEAEVSVMVFAIDPDGSMWACRVSANAFSANVWESDAGWTSHGKPVDGVRAKSGLGVAWALPPVANLPPLPPRVFVIGDDGQLHMRNADQHDYVEPPAGRKSAPRGVRS